MLPAVIAVISCLSIIDSVAGQGSFNCSNPDEFIPGSCPNELQNVYKQLQAIQSTITSTITPTMLQDKNVVDQVTQYCQVTTALGNCVGVSLTTSSCDDPKALDTNANYLRMGLVVALGDPRAYLSDIEGCANMTQLFFDGAKLDVNLELHCVMTCARPYTESKAGQEVNILGLCKRSNPALSDCLKRCSLSETTAAYCNADTANTPGGGPAPLNTDSCSAGCAKGFTAGGVVNLTTVLGLCIEKSDLQNCMQSCPNTVEDGQLLATCQMPPSCAQRMQEQEAKPRDTSSNMTQQACSTMPFILECQLPMILLDPNEAAAYKSSFKQLKETPGFDTDASATCKEIINTIESKIDNAVNNQQVLPPIQSISPTDQYQQNLICGQTCMYQYLSADPGQAVSIVGLCQDHPDVERCMQGCNTDPSLIATCKLPKNCVKTNGQPFPGDNVTDTCNNLSTFIQCQLPLMVSYPNVKTKDILMMLQSIQMQPGFATQASAECSATLAQAMGVLSPGAAQQNDEVVNGTTLEQRQLCSQQCMLAAQVQGDNAQNSVYGICTKNPQVLTCMVNCQAPDQLMTICQLPDECNNPNAQQQFPNDNVTASCDILPFFEKCSVPLISVSGPVNEAPFALAGIYTSFKAMPGFADQASADCQAQVDKAISALSSATQNALQQAPATTSRQRMACAYACLVQESGTTITDGLSSLIGLCIKYPKVNACVANCNAQDDPEIVYYQGLCNLPLDCVTFNQDNFPGANVSETCSQMELFIKCALPLYQFVPPQLNFPSQAEAMLQMIPQIPGWQSDASPECKEAYGGIVKKFDTVKTSGKLQVGLKSNQEVLFSQDADPNSASVQCTQTCIQLHSTLVITGACTTYPDLALCLKMCQSDVGITALCSVPLICQEKQGPEYAFPGANVTDTCDKLDDYIQCMLPLLASPHTSDSAENTARFLLTGIKSMPGYDTDASEQCKTGIDDAIISATQDAADTVDTDAINETLGAESPKCTTPDETVMVAVLACTTEMNNAYATAFALDQLFDYALDADALDDANISASVDAFCKSVNSASTCFNGVISGDCGTQSKGDDSDVSDVKALLTSYVKYELASWYGDPRAFLSNVSAACQQMTNTYFPSSVPNTDLDNKLCQYTCSLRLDPWDIEPGTLLSDPSICKDPATILACQVHCGVAAGTPPVCGPKDVDISPSDAQEQAQLVCGHTCLAKYNANATLDDRYELVGMCQKYPELDTCMKECNTDPVIIGLCNAPTKCANLSDNDEETASECIKLFLKASGNVLPLGDFVRK